MSTALRKYQRLEATALWRPTPEEQRREVIVSIGDATLVITDMQDRALTHWSLPALQRANPGSWPALYHPDGDSGETLELAEGEAEMVAAIEKLRAAIEKRRPRPGRLRWWMMGLSLSSVLAVGVFWLPGAVVDHTISVLAASQKRALGEALLAEAEGFSGQRCQKPAQGAVLTRLAERMRPIAPDTLDIHVVRDSQVEVAMLPGNLMLLNSRLLEDHEVPDVAAGYILAELLRAGSNDPLHALLSDSGMLANLQLLATGTLDATSLRNHAEALLSGARGATVQPIQDEALLMAFRTAEVKSTPYAYAVDVSGETTLALIEADPFPQAAPRPVLSDADWLRLQAICEG